jgi:hypothetical protein
MKGRGFADVEDSVDRVQRFDLRVEGYSGALWQATASYGWLRLAVG